MYYDTGAKESHPDMKCVSPGDVGSTVPAQDLLEHPCIDTGIDDHDQLDEGYTELELRDVVVT